MHWTPEQIVAFAPDAAAAKAAEGLAVASRWSGAGGDGRFLWGLCQGSGSRPYQAQVDLSEPAWKCSCPSRKFPCKHGLALLLLRARDPGRFEAGEPPEWTGEWRTRRASKGAAASAEPAAVEPAPPPLMESKTAERRRQRVTDGIADLRQWLDDLMRTGLAAATGHEPAFWSAAAARLTDAQAPGLARSLRELGQRPASGAGWQMRMLEQAARLHLLMEAYGRLDTLPPDLAADVRTLIGWTEDQAELRQQPGLRDTWQVLGQRVEMEERLLVQRTWLRGRASGRTALLLTYAFGSTPPASGLRTGSGFTGELVYFPGRQGLRALVKSRNEEELPFQPPPGQGIADALREWSGRLAAFPWLARWPLLLQPVTPARKGEEWTLRDAEGRPMPLRCAPDCGWQLMALSGGAPLTVFGEWDGERLAPLSAMAAGDDDGRWVELAQ